MHSVFFWVFFEKKWSNVLPVSKVDPSEQGIVLRAGSASVVLIQEHRRTAHFQAQLLDALFIVDRQQEGLATLLWFHRSQDGKVLREGITWQKDGGLDRAKCVRFVSQPQPFISPRLKMMQHLIQEFCERIVISWRELVDVSRGNKCSIVATSAGDGLDWEDMPKGFI